MRTGRTERGRIWQPRSTAAAFLALAMVLVACGGDDADDDTDPSAEDGGDAEEPEAVATGPDGESDWEPEWVDDELQPLPDGFPDQPITLINVDDAGTPSGLYTRAIQQAIEEGGLSPVEIRISDEPRAQGGTIHTAVEVYEEREGGDQGYYPVSMSLAGTATDFFVDPITEETGATFEDLNFSSSTEIVPYVMQTRMDAPWGTDFDAFIEHARENTLDFFEVVGNFNTLACQWMLQEFDIETNNIPVGDREEMVTALAAGEGDFGCTQPHHAVQAEGRTVPIWMPTYELHPWFEEANSDMGTLNDHEEYGANELALGAQNGWLLHAGIPTDHALWLNELVSKAAEQESYLQREDTVPGLTIQVLSMEEANAAARQAYELMEPVIKEAGVHIEDR